MAEESDLELFLSDIKEDPNYKKFRLVVKGVREKLKIERDQAEAMGLMANRTSRSLHGRKQFSPKSLLEATSNDLSARARLVEIRVRSIEQLQHIDHVAQMVRCRIYVLHDLVQHVYECLSLGHQRSGRTLHTLDQCFPLFGTATELLQLLCILGVDVVA
jgi:hypothetical protein